MKNTIQAVIFDCDGTLVDSEVPGALALPERLTIPFCVATNGSREKAELTLGLTGLLKYFPDRLFSACEVELQA